MVNAGRSWAMLRPQYYGTMGSRLCYSCIPWWRFAVWGAPASAFLLNSWGAFRTFWVMIFSNAILKSLTSPYFYAAVAWKSFTSPKYTAPQSEIMLGDEPWGNQSVLLDAYWWSYAVTSGYHCRVVYLYMLTTWLMLGSTPWWPVLWFPGKLLKP